MKTIVLVFSVFVALCVSQRAIAQIPRVMSYQGVLRAEGRLFNGDAHLVFKLSRGSETVWTSASLTVPVDEGVFGVMLGPFPQELNFVGIDSLGIVFEGMELSPRVGLSASPFSFSSYHAAIADSALTPGPPGPPGGTGPVGAPGSKGDAGVSGASGPKGDAGLQGSSGAQGAAGSPGSPGLKGDKGDSGLQGSPGAQGAAGSPGSPGLKGDKGDSGLQGSPGAQGAAGSQGSPGLKGDKGDAGLQGSPGAQGAAGSPGSPGLKGDKGDTGLQGGAGAQGVPGAPGSPGMKGDKGDSGVVGPQGMLGPVGPKGESGDAVPGPKGDQGPPGLQASPDVSPIASADVSDGSLVFGNAYGRLERTGVPDQFRLTLVSPHPSCHFTAYWYSDTAGGTDVGVKEGTLLEITLPFHQFDLAGASQFTIMFGDADGGQSYSKVEIFRTSSTGKWFGFVATH